MSKKVDKKEDLFNKALAICEDPETIFIEDVIAELPCGKTTFYERFPIDSNELNTLKEKIALNRITTKRALRKDWKKGGFPAQIALYKLCSTKEELEILNMTRDNNQPDDKAITVEIIYPQQLTTLPSSESEIKTDR